MTVKLWPYSLKLWPCSPHTRKRYGGEARTAMVLQATNATRTVAITEAKKALMVMATVYVATEAEAMTVMTVATVGVVKAELKTTVAETTAGRRRRSRWRRR